MAVGVPSEWQAGRYFTTPAMVSSMLIYSQILLLAFTICNVSNAIYCGCIVLMLSVSGMQTKSRFLRHHGISESLGSSPFMKKKTPETPIFCDCNLIQSVYLARQKGEISEATAALLHTISRMLS